MPGASDQSTNSCMKFGERNYIPTGSPPPARRAVPRALAALRGIGGVATVYFSLQEQHDLRWIWGVFSFRPEVAAEYLRRRRLLVQMPHPRVTCVRCLSVCVCPIFEIFAKDIILCAGFTYENRCRNLKRSKRGSRKLRD